MAFKAVEWSCLFGALAAFTVTEEYQTYVTLGLAALAISFVARWLRTGVIYPITGLEAPVFLFMGSAFLAAWAAYDHSLALLHLARILAGITLFASLVQGGEKLRCWSAVVFVLAAGALAIYFPLQHDYASSPAKFALIATLGRAINSLVSPQQVRALLGSAIHPNVAAGALGLAVPFSGAILLGAWQEKKRTAALLAGLALLFSLTGLALTSSRGAWLGLAFALALIVLLAVQRRWFSSLHMRVVYWLVILLGVVLLVGWGFSSGQSHRILGKLPGAEGSLLDRMEIWDQAQGLMRDYIFTGGGLQSFRLLHAVYGLLIPSPALDHIHNTLLEVWIEQGIFGFAALLWGGVIVLSWAWRASRAPLPDHGVGRYLQWAAFAGLAMAALHGLFDSVLYVTRLLPLVALALGLAYAQREGDTRHAGVSLLALGLLLLAAGGGLLFSAPLRAMLYANLGAVAQTRAELAVYDPFLWDETTLDEVRLALDLSPAEAYFQQSLSIDPLNVTALTRLGQIEMSRGRYDRAYAYAALAWEDGNRDDITRLIYGDALIARGEMEAAASSVAGVSWAQNRILGHAWYRYWLAQDYSRAASAWGTVLLLDPGNEYVQYWHKRAESALNK